MSAASASSEWYQGLLVSGPALIRDTFHGSPILWPSDPIVLALFLCCGAGFQPATTAFEPACLLREIPHRHRTIFHGIPPSSTPLAAIRKESVPDLASGRQPATPPIPSPRRPLQRSGVCLAGSLS